MTFRCLVLTLTLLPVLPATVIAQGASPDVSPDGDAGEGGGTYLKMGLAHWQGDIFSARSLTQWTGNLFGSDYNLTSAEVEIEIYFDRPLLLLSGWSIGYRKDELRQVDSGHMLYASAFRSLNVGAFELRAGGGMEWGVPSLNFDTTEFDYRADGTLGYNHTYPVKNVNVPRIGTTKDGVLYPFVELSVVQRPGRLLVEGGMRVNIVPFQFDTYEVDLNDRITYAFDSKRVLMPMLFVEVGVRVF